MSKEFNVSLEYPGYVFVGCAQGIMDKDNPDGSIEKIPYFHMFALCPVSGYSSDTYQASGLKAEKKKCLNAEVWEGLKPGDRVKLFFDDKGRIVMTALDQ